MHPLESYYLTWLCEQGQKSEDKDYYFEEIKEHIAYMQRTEQHNKDRRQTHEFFTT